MHSIISVLYTADGPAFDNECAIRYIYTNTNVYIYQEVCMNRFIFSEMSADLRPLYIKLDSYFLNGLDPSADICNWNGVSCTDGLVTSMIIDHSQPKSAVAHMDWIPPTVRAFSMHSTMTYGGYSAAALPRDLRFFFLKTCGDSLFRTPLPRTIDFRALPPKLEEFFSVNSCRRGPVFLDNLPRSLRIFYLKRIFMKEVFIAFETLPLGLEMMRITFRKEKPVRIIPTGGLHKDARVTSTNKDIGKSFVEASRYKAHIFAPLV